MCTASLFFSAHHLASLCGTALFQAGCQIGPLPDHPSSGTPRRVSKAGFRQTQGLLNRVASRYYRINSFTLHFNTAKYDTAASRYDGWFLTPSLHGFKSVFTKLGERSDNNRYAPQAPPLILPARLQVRIYGARRQDGHPRKVAKAPCYIRCTTACAPCSPCGPQRPIRSGRT
ncbi:hypothetical protein C8F04DRAFT_713272 [Mycena alexandri]|uniref:Uncharacterized protein n=1 Tax=Mycena alexandri TaxID=1745969 RepID=A0AAD6SN19_9AGAR|nr:hypothetical protein C8F04DRAFT_713272 [Mycena alexandri]